MKPFNKSIATVAAALALVGLNACDTSTPVSNAPVNGESNGLAFTDIKAPKDFAFSVYNEKGLTVQLKVKTTEGEVAYSNATVKIIEGGSDKVLATYVTDVNGEIKYDGANLSSLAPSVGVQVYAAGISEETLWYTAAELETLDRIVVVNPDSYNTVNGGSAKIAAKGAVVSRVVAPTAGRILGYENHPQADFQLVTTNLFVEYNDLNIDPAWLGTTEITIDALTDPNQKDEIWAHFMHSGAGYKNAFGYYWYKKSENPNGDLALVNMETLYDEISGIDFNIQYGAPKVLVGTVTDFKTLLADANDEIVIGFWLHQDYGRGAKPNKPVWYSNTAYNVAEYGSAQEFHHVSFPSTSDRTEAVIAIEDQTLPHSDKDYNDLILIVDLLEELTPSRCDIDPSECITCRTPEYNKASRLAFEDKYPEYGDFDYNDVVVDVDYRIESKVCQIEIAGQFFPIIDDSWGAEFAPQLVSGSIDVTPIANGAMYPLGFSIALDIAGATTTVDNAVASSVTTNGSETIIDFFSFMRGEFVDVNFVSPSTIFVNTAANEPGFPYAPKATYGADIVFAAGTPIPASPLATVKPFIFKTDDISDEIHFKGQSMTSRGVAQDLTGSPAEGHPYEDDNGIPWAVELAQSTQYPLEFIDFTEAYPQYSAWVQTGTPSNWASTGVASKLY